MIVKSLLLLQRNLREDARGIMAYLLAGGAALVSALFLWLFVEESWNRGAAGRDFLWMMVWIDFAFLVVLGLAQFSSAISEEKEAQTLGLLRMAGVSTTALLAGKLANRLFLALQLLVVQMPFAVLAVSLGGVGFTTVLAALLVLGALTVKLAGIGLFSSVLMSSRQGAAMLGLAILFCSEALPYLGIWVDWLGDRQLWAGWDVLLRLSSFEHLRQLSFSLVDADQLVDPRLWWSLGLGLVGIVAAGLCFDRFAIDSGPDEGGRGGLLGFLHHMPGLHAGRAWQGDALVWKDLHFVLGGRPGLLLRLSVVVTGVVLLWATFEDEFAGRGYSHSAWVWRQMGGVLLSIAGILWLVEVGWNLARAFQRERQVATWPALFALPVSLGALCRSKVQAALLVSAPLFLTALAGSILLGEWDDDDFWCIIVILVSWSSVYWHLSIYFSLVLRWGAFALAALIVVVLAILEGSVMAMLLFRSSSGQAAITTVAILTGAAGCLLWIPIRRRLRRLAHELN